MVLTHNLLDRVCILNADGQPERWGTFVGTATIIYNDALSLKYIVKLDAGFYNEDKTAFITHLVVDPGGVR